MIQDLKFAVRQLLKSPGFTIAAVIVLALGIGANTAVFSLVHTMFFAPPGYARPHEVVQVFSQDKKNPKTFRGFSYPTYRDIREQNSVFTEVMAYNLAMVGLGQKGDTRRAFAAMVSANYFSVLGVPLAQGRTFLAGRGNARPRGARRDRQLRLLGETFPRSGVARLAIAHQRPPLHDRRHRAARIHRPDADYLAGSVAAARRLRSGRERFREREQNEAGRSRGTAAARRRPAQAGHDRRQRPSLRLKGLAANLEKAFPVEQKDQTFQTTPISRFSISTSPSGEGGMSKLAPMLLGMAIVVLLVACLNLANMLLARGTARRKEIAIRLALGGSRCRIVRQLLTEGLVLALLGGACGLVLGLWSSDLLVTSLGKMLPLDIVWLGGPNPAILAATFGFCVLGTLGFALGPALKLSRSAVVADLKEQAGEDVVRRRWKFLPRNPLVVVQIAFSLALLTAAALFIRGAGKAASVDTGLQPGASFLLETDASLAGYEPKRGAGTLPQPERAAGRIARRRACERFRHGAVRDDLAEQERAARRLAAGARREAGHRRGRSGLQRRLEQRRRGLLRDGRAAGLARPRFQRGGSDAIRRRGRGDH